MKWLSISLLLMTLMGCQSLKDASVVGTTAAAGATAGVVMSGGLLAPAAGAMLGGATGSLIQDLNSTEVEEAIVNKIEHESVFMLAEKLVKVAGWWLVLALIGPWLLGWAMPSPMEFKKNGKHLNSKHE